MRSIMKTNIAIMPLILCFCSLARAQTGINTTTPDPSSVLDIESTDKGLLIPRVFLTAVTDATTITSPAKSLVVFNTNTNILEMPYGEGLYYNSGTPGDPVWDKLATQESEFTLQDIVSLVATAPVDVSAGTRDDIDIGMSVEITVPADTIAKILLDYSVPMGTNPLDSSNDNVGGYFGIRFLKNGTEEPMGSRKFSVPFSNSGTHMVSVGGKFTEEVVNNTASDITITYTLNGYIESTDTGTRFNMAAVDPDPNFNWGRAAMTATVFVKNDS